MAQRKTNHSDKGGIGYFFSGLADKFVAAVTPATSVQMYHVKEGKTSKLAIEFSNAKGMEQFLEKMPAFGHVANNNTHTITIAASTTGGCVIAEFSSWKAADAFLDWCQLDHAHKFIKHGASQILFLDPQFAKEGSLKLSGKLKYPDNTALVVPPRYYAPASPGEQGSMGLPHDAVQHIVSVAVIHAHDPFFTLSVLAQVSQAFYQYAMQAQKEFLGNADNYAKALARVRGMNPLQSLLDAWFREKNRDTTGVTRGGCHPAHELSPAWESEIAGFPHYKKIWMHDHYNVKGQWLTDTKDPDINAQSIVNFFSQSSRKVYAAAIYRHPTQSAQFLVPINAKPKNGHDVVQEHLDMLGVGHYLHEHPYYAAESRYLRADKFLFQTENVTLVQPKADSVEANVNTYSVATQVSGLLGSERSQEADEFPFMEVMQGEQSEARENFIPSEIILRFKAEPFARDLAYKLKESKLFNPDAIKFQPLAIHVNEFIDDKNYKQQFTTTANLRIVGKSEVEKFLRFCGFKKDAVDMFLPQLNEKWVNMPQNTSSSMSTTTSTATSFNIL